VSVRRRTWTTEKGVEKSAWVVDYVDTAGKRRLKSFAKKKEADAFSAKASVEIRDGVHVADNATITVSEAGELWLRTAEESGLERATTDQYRQHIKLHIDPFLGSTKLNKLTVPAVRAYQERLREEGRSVSMIKRVTVSLGSIFSDAQERGLINRNVVREMAGRRSKGKARHSERRQRRKLQVGVDIPTPAEIRAIIENVQGRWRPMMITAVFSGMRASELRGVRWVDVEFDDRAIHVRQRADRYRDIGMPKSEAGQRVIPVPPMVVNSLREWKLKAPKSDLDLIFPNKGGSPLAAPKLASYLLWPPQIASGLVVDTGKTDPKGNPVIGPKYRGMHALRHFYASWCINRRSDGGLELPLKAVQERLGHSSITMTMDTYGHLFPRGDDAEELATAEMALMSAI